MGFLQILDRVCIGHREDFHPGGFRAPDTRDRVFDHQAGFGSDGLLSTLSIQPVEGLEKGLRIGLSSGHVFCAGDVQKCWSEPSGSLGIRVSRSDRLPSFCNYLFLLLNPAAPLHAGYGSGGLHFDGVQRSPYLADHGRTALLCERDAEDTI